MSLGVELELLLVGGRGEGEFLLVDHPHCHRRRQFRDDLTRGISILLTRLTNHRRLGEVGTYLLAPGVGELAAVRRPVGRVPLERLPALVSRSGTDDLGRELDFSVERGRRADSEELGSLFDQWGSAEMGVDLGAESWKRVSTWQ